MFGSVIKRSLFQWRFLCLVLLAAAVLLLGEADKLSYAALYVIYRTVIFSQTSALLAAIICSPSTFAFCEDRENNFSHYSKMRTSNTNYGLSWLFSNFITVILGSVLTYTFAYAFLVWFTPSETRFPYSNLGVYAELVERFPIVFPVLTGLYQGLNYCLIVEMTYIVLLRLPNKFVAVGFPMIAQQVLYMLTPGFPAFLNFHDLALVDTVFQGRSILYHMGYVVMFFSFFCILTGMLFMKKNKKYA